MSNSLNNETNERTIILTGFVLISKWVIFNEPKLNSCFGCCFLFVQNTSIGSNWAGNHYLIRVCFGLVTRVNFSSIKCKSHYQWSLACVAYSPLYRGFNQSRVDPEFGYKLRGVQTFTKQIGKSLDWPTSPPPPPIPPYLRLLDICHQFSLSPYILILYVLKGK